MKNYDPSLREAMAEIEEIMKKHDCGGFVTLQSKSHTEFKLMLDHMSWSMIRWIKDGESMHLKLYSKSSKENTDATVGMLYSIRYLCGMVFMQMDKLANQIEQSVKVEHVPFGPHGITNEDR